MLLRQAHHDAPSRPHHVVVPGPTGPARSTLSASVHRRPKRRGTARGSRQLSLHSSRPVVEATQLAFASSACTALSLERRRGFRHEVCPDLLVFFRCARWGSLVPVAEAQAAPQKLCVGGGPGAATLRLPGAGDGGLAGDELHAIEARPLRRCPDASREGQTPTCRCSRRALRCGGVRSREFSRSQRGLPAREQHGAGLIASRHGRHVDGRDRAPVWCEMRRQSYSDSEEDLSGRDGLCRATGRGPSRRLTMRPSEKVAVSAVHETQTGFVRGRPMLASVLRLKGVVEEGAFGSRDEAGVLLFAVVGLARHAHPPRTTLSRTVAFPWSRGAYCLGVRESASALPARSGAKLVCPASGTVSGPRLTIPSSASLWRCLRRGLGPRGSGPL